MPKVTSGHVLFQRVKKDDDYGIVRKAEVMFAFATPDGGPEDAHLLITSDLAGDAVRFVNAILSRAPGADLSDVQTTTKLTSTAPAPTQTAAAGGKTKEQLAADAVAAAGAPKAAPRKAAAKPPATPPAPPAQTTADDAASMEDVSDPSSPPAAAAQAPAPAPSPGTANADSAADMSDEDLFAAAPADITDEQILAEITRKNAEIKNPPAIRMLVGKYIAPPGNARQIDKKLRAKFLEELGTLKAAG